MNPHDHPDLTAHVLGELDAEHDEAMTQWIAQNPEAHAEADAVACLSQHLRAAAVVPPVTLHAHQREAILSGPQLVRKMVEVASQKQKRRVNFGPVLQSVGRIAIAASLLIVGFLTGLRFTQQAPKTLVAQEKDVTPSSDKPKQEPFRSKEVNPMVAAELPKVQTPAPVVAQAPVVEVPKVQPEPARTDVVAKVEVAAVSTSPAAKEPARLPRIEMKVTDEALVATTKTAVSQVSIHPATLRPAAPRPTTDLVAAAPITSREKPVAPVAPARKPELRIHSWKAEVASCPWDETHRLVRLSIQLPGEQAAALQDQSYPMQVTFQQGYVRSYRQLGQRTIAAPKADEAALHIVWYELVPNGNPADRSRDESGKSIASVMLPNAMFTTTAMGPFDGATKLQIVDRGTPWQEASDDFLFESSLTGFRLLLKGSGTPALNHNLVLDLAERGVKNDRTGERARFVKLVRDAQKVSGL